jgi:hypothetical protein
MSKCWLSCGRDRLPHSEIELCGICSARCYRYIEVLKAMSPKQREEWFMKQDAVYKSKQLLRDRGLVALSSKAQRQEYTGRDDVKVLNRMLVLVIKESTTLAVEQAQQRQLAKVARAKPTRGRRHRASGAFRLPSHAAYGEARA